MQNENLDSTSQALVSEIFFNDESFHFSAGHFTVFSATERERLHGHTYQVGAKVWVELQEDGLNFDYRTFKKIMRELCENFNTRFLLPTKSKFCDVEQRGENVIVTFNKQSMQLLSWDVLCLPLSNITVETLSHWLCDKIISEAPWLKSCGALKLAVSVANGRKQGASAERTIK